MDKEAPVAFYHCISRIVDRNFVLGDLEKEHFVKLMRAYEMFCGVKVITFCIMTNHFHILVEVPRRPLADQLPSDEQLVTLLKSAASSYGAATLAQRLQKLRTSAQHSEAEALRVTGRFKMYHPRSNQSVPPRGVGFLGLAGYFWQGLVVWF